MVNIEYDVPQCAAGTPAKDCTHEVRNVAPLGYFDVPSQKLKIDLAYAAPHLHVSGISLELQGK